MSRGFRTLSFAQIAVFALIATGCGVEAQKDRPTVTDRVEETQAGLAERSLLGPSLLATAESNNWGVEFWTRSDIGKAIDSLDAVVRLAPGGQTNDGVRGIEEFLARDPTLVLKDINAFLELNPRNGFAFCVRGGLYFDMGEFDLAEKDLTKALELVSPKVLAAGTRAYVVLMGMRGHCYLRAGDLDAAVEDLSRAINSDRGDEQLLLDRGLAYSLQGMNREALEDYGEALRVDPSSVVAYHRRGAILHQAGDIDGAILDYSKAIDAGYVSPILYCNRAIAFSDKALFRDSIEDLDRAIELSAQNPALYEWRGYVYSLMGDIERSIEDYNEAIRLKPEDPDLHFTRARLFERTQNWQAAVTDYSRVLRLDRANADAANDFAWLLATCRDASVRDGERAFELANAACELSKWNNWSFIGTLAAACAEKGDYDQAIRYQKQVLSAEGLTNTERDNEEQRLELFKHHKPYRESGP